MTTNLTREQWMLANALAGAFMPVMRHFASASTKKKNRKRSTATGITSTVCGADDLQQPIAARGDVVGQQVDAVEAADGQNRVTFPFVAVAGVPFVDGEQFAPEHFGKEVAVAAGGFEKARVDAFALVGDEVEHVVDQARGGEDLTMVDDALTRFHGCNHTDSTPNE